MRIVPASEDAIAEAARLLVQGKLIGMPTETVYGIAANAFDRSAVLATFEAKGRPAENPLIVHVATLVQARAISKDLPPIAQILAERFWPGPLTLVVMRSPDVPDEVTAGLETVAIRMPSHPVARRLIELSGVPISAPSANRFMGLSPTTADSISADVAARLALILDGGPCAVGIESTVLDLTGETPVILRPGNVSLAQIREFTPEAAMGTLEDNVRRSPGMYRRHYAPKTPVHLVDRLNPDQPGLTFQEAGKGQLQMPSSAERYAQVLYLSLHQLDAKGLPAIYVEKPPQESTWDAVWDRLRKASSQA